MRKHEKKRIKGIKLMQKISKAKRRVYDAYATQAGGKPDSELFADATIINRVVASLSTKTLQLLINHPKRFTFPRKNELYRLAQDAVMERTFKLERE